MANLLLLTSVGLTVTNASVAIIAAIPAGQLWEVKSVFIQQPSTAVLKTFALGLGTLTTVADADAILSRSLLAGQYSEVIHCPIGLTTGATLNVIVSAGTTELSIAVFGYKNFTA